MRLLPYVLTKALAYVPSTPNSWIGGLLSAAVAYPRIAGATNAGRMAEVALGTAALNVFAAIMVCCRMGKCGVKQ